LKRAIFCQTDVWFDLVVTRRWSPTPHPVIVLYYWDDWPCLGFNFRCRKPISVCYHCQPTPRSTQPGYPAVCRRIWVPTTSQTAIMLCGWGV